VAPYDSRPTPDSATAVAEPLPAQRIYVPVKAPCDRETPRAGERALAVYDRSEPAQLQQILSSFE